MFIFNKGRSVSRFVSCCLLFLFFSCTTVHATLVNLTYQIDVSHPRDCGRGVPGIGCVSSGLSETLDLFVNSFPGTMELRYQYDTTATPAIIKPEAYIYPQSNADISIGDHVLSAIFPEERSSVTRPSNAIYVVQNADEDIVAIDSSSALFEFVNGPLIGNTVTIDLITSAFRTSNTDYLTSFALPEPSVLEGFDGLPVLEGLDNVVHQFSSSSGVIGFSDISSGDAFVVAQELTSFNIDSQSESVVHEPSSIALLIFGLAGIGYQQRKRSSV